LSGKTWLDKILGKLHHKSNFILARMCVPLCNLNVVLDTPIFLKPPQCCCPKHQIQISLSSELCQQSLSSSSLQMQWKNACLPVVSTLLANQVRDAWKIILHDFSMTAVNSSSVWCAFIPSANARLKLPIIPLLAASRLQASSRL